MAWPTGVTLRTCSLGPDFGIVSGDDYGCDIVVSVSRPMMTWGATGSGGIGDQDSLSFTPGLEITFQLPVTDQAGWYIGGLPIDVSDGQQSHVYTLTIKPWIYNSLGRKTFSNATLTLSNLAVPTGADTLDLDKSVATAGAQGGTVTIPDLVGQLQATVETSATDAAASASAAAASAQTAHDISNIDTSDDVVSTLVADPQTGPKTTAALNAAYAAFVLVTDPRFGAVGDGATDDTAAVQAAIDAVGGGPGGCVFFPPGTYLIGGELTFPNDGATPVAGQGSIILRGAAPTRTGNFATPLVGSVLMFTGTRAEAFIDTRGMGYLGIEDLTLTTDDTSGIPFVRTTNTVLGIRRNRFLGPQAADGTYVPVHDAIVLGGTANNGTFDMTAEARFQGYGTLIEGNEFDCIRHGVLGQAACNSIVVRDNYWHSTCGGPAAIEIHSYQNKSSGWYVAGNCIEVEYYEYGVILYDAISHMFVGNAYWDYARSNYMTAAIALQGTPGGAINNTFLDFFQGIPVSKQVVDQAGGNQWLHLSNGVWHGKSIFGDGPNSFSIQPTLATGSEETQLLQVYRSGSEPVGPNALVFYVKQKGRITAGGTDAGFTADNNGTSVRYSWDGVATDNGPLSLYPATNAAVKIARGWFKTAAYTTATRPSASTAGAGAHIFDTTLNKPIWSDGTNWKDAVGTAV